MLRLFQVTEGRFLPLEREIPPTARVAELCSIVEAVSGEEVKGQVLMTSSGQQMDPSNIIGTYSVGTDTKPIFVFFHSQLHSASFPSRPSLIMPRPDLQQQLQVLTQRPSPTHFQRQVALAKLLGERSVELGGLCERLGHELALQEAGWAAVLSNCHGIVRTYRKHQQVFSKVVATFSSSKPHYLNLLTEFPSQLTLLQTLPLPSTDTTMASSLYDWISTHDEKNSLVDLGTECRKALAQADGENIQSAIATSEEILGSIALASLEAPPPLDSPRVQELLDKAAETTQVQSSLAENVQSTSQRALRSGDAGTVAVLVLSHQRTLSLMAQQNSQLEQWAEELETAKSAMSQYIHRQLRLVVELQMRISDSNSQLLLLHEHIKLATKRFEVLEQVYSVPGVLGSVLGEVARRRGFRAALEQRAHEVSSHLRHAREEEKQLRRQFLSTHGGHFLTTLFPELESRAPEVKLQLSHGESDAEHAPSEPVLARIRELLPSEFCPPPTPLLDLSASSPRTPLADHAVQTQHPVDQRGGPTELSAEGPGTQQGLVREEELQHQLAEKASQMEAERAQWVAERREILERSSTLSTELQRCQDECEAVRAECAAIKAEATAAATVAEGAEAVSRLQEQLQVERDKMAHLSQQLQAEREEALGLRQQAEREEALGLRQQAEREEALGLRQQTEREEALGLRQQVEREEALGLRQQVEREEALGLRQQAENELARLREQLEERDAKLGQLQVLLEEGKDERAELCLQGESRAAENTELKQQLKESHSEIESLQQQLETSAAELHTLKQSCEEGSAELATLKQKSAYQSTVAVGLQQKCADLEEECSRQNARHHQAQVALSNARAQLDQAETQAQDVSRQLTEARRKLVERETELENELSKHKVYVMGLEDQLSQERERAVGLEDQLSQEKERAVGLEDQLSQERERAVGLEDQLSQERERAVRLEDQLSRERERAVGLEDQLSQERERGVRLEDQLSQEKERAVGLEDQLSQEKERAVGLEDQLSQEKERAVGLEDQLSQEKERAVGLEDQLSRERERAVRLEDQLSQERERAVGLEDQLSRERERAVVMERQLSVERDGHMKQSMELERELKELRRDVDETSLPEMGRHSPQKSSSVAMATSEEKVAISNLQVGDLAFFLSDQYRNYLALSVDGKIYYLNQACVPAFAHDLSGEVTQLQLRRKLLLGRITARLLVEVRKEGNRLRVPVGSRLYKVDAVEMTVS